MSLENNLSVMYFGLRGHELAFRWRERQQNLPEFIIVCFDYRFDFSTVERTKLALTVVWHSRVQRQNYFRDPFMPDNNNPVVHSWRVIGFVVRQSHPDGREHNDLVENVLFVSTVPMLVI